uniref:Alternative protein FBXW2 n=1 Tax=Homo sapiens TaxID=9606 RepID=L8EAL9_HUMAN|nr:alternative protein FBXW2 [Homo sapiens]
MNQSSHLMVSSRSAQSFIYVLPGARARGGGGLVLLTYNAAC